MAERLDRPMEKTPMEKQKVFNPVSPFLVVLVAAMVLVELILQAAEWGLIGGPEAIGWRLDLARDFGFHKAVFEHLLVGGVIEPKVIWPFFSYIFVHQSFAHMVVAAALILGMGKMISDRFSGTSVLVLFFGCGVMGALAFGVFSTSGGFPLIGAYPVFYGFIGTYTWISVAALRKQQKNILPAFNVVGLLLLFRGAFALVYGLSNSWSADLAGLITGFLLAYILGPEGKARIKSWINAARNR